MPEGDPWRRRILGDAAQPTKPPATAQRDAPREGKVDEGGDAWVGERRVVPIRRRLAPRSTQVSPPSYRLAAFALLAWALSLLLAAIDEYRSVPHAAATNAALFLVGVLAIFSLSLTLRRARAWRRAHTAAVFEFRDEVTGLPNHRYLHLRLEEEVARARRYRRPLALVIIGVNSLQSMNEQYGWGCGDQVLRHLADVMQSRRRGSDTVTRLADDRFALILPECDEEGARSFVERLEQHLLRSPARVQVDGKTFDLWLGMCAGMGFLREKSERPSELIAEAETDLRAAKDERNHRRDRWQSA